MTTREIYNLLFIFLTKACSYFCLFILIFLISSTLIKAWPELSFEFLNSYPSRFANKAGIKAALVGSFYLICLTSIIALPVGILSALCLEEYIPKKSFTKKILELNISNLASMPSIVYGLIGLALFARFLNFGTSLISGALTLSLLILPIIIVSTQAALKTVPKAISLAGYAMGAHKYQIVFGLKLPYALTGILTGVILSISRAIGESAPLIIVGAVGYVSFLPDNLFDSYTVLPVQIFNWAGRPSADFHNRAAAAIIILLLVLLSFNIFAIYLRQKSIRNTKS